MLANCQNILTVLTLRWRILSSRCTYGSNVCFLSGTTQDSFMLPASPVRELPISQDWFYRMKLVCNSCLWCNVLYIFMVFKTEREREMFYLTTHSTHFIYGYMASDIWLRTILIVRKETRCRHIGYSYRLTARVILYAPSHRQDDTYHGLCYTSRSDDPSHHERTLYL